MAVGEELRSSKLLTVSATESLVCALLHQPTARAARSSNCDL
jgi:hypothetical protein